VAFFVIGGIIVAITGGANADRDEAVLAEIDRIYGTEPGCLADANDGDWQETAVVLDSQSTDRLVIVEVYLTRTLTGEDLTYRFGVPVDDDGKATGGATPGNALTSSC
jgi:hypothetical protein